MGFEGFRIKAFYHDCRTRGPLQVTLGAAPRIRPHGHLNSVSWYKPPHTTPTLHQAAPYLLSLGRRRARSAVGPSTRPGYPQCVRSCQGAQNLSCFARFPLPKAGRCDPYPGKFLEIFRGGGPNGQLFATGKFHRTRQGLHTGQLRTRWRNLNSFQNRSVSVGF